MDLVDLTYICILFIDNHVETYSIPCLSIDITAGLIHIFLHNCKYILPKIITPVYERPVLPHRNLQYCCQIESYGILSKSIKLFINYCFIAKLKRKS